jgi:hypothetical protein
MPGSNWIECENQDDPLIIQLYNKQQKNISLETFVLEDIIKPLLNTYFDALIFAGIELEAHAQNMLIAIDNNYQIIQIVCRDLESAGRDISLMEFLGIKYNNIANNYKFITDNVTLRTNDYSDYQRTHSFMFDFKLGEYIITPIIDTICSYKTSINRDLLTNEIKEFCDQFICKLPKNYYPDKWCDYDDIIWTEMSEKKYNWYDNPKYRKPSK